MPRLCLLLAALLLSGLAVGLGMRWWPAPAETDEPAETPDRPNRTEKKKVDSRAILAAHSGDAAGDALTMNSAGVTFFEQKIRPVLVRHCYKCHSAQSKKPRGGLLLDTRAGLRKGGDSGP